MLRMLRTSAAVIVAASLLAAPLAAQTAPAAPAAPVVTAPAAPATTAAPAAAAVPQALADLGATDVTVTEGKRGGQRVRATLPGGVAAQGMLDDEGALRMLRATGDGAALPAETLARLLPQAVRDSAVMGELAQVQGVARGPQGVMVFGADSAGQPVRAGFSADGTLQRFGRGDDRPDDRDRARGKGHDKRHDRDARHDRRERGDDERREDRGPRGGGERGAQGGPLTPEALRSTLADAGYTQPGAIGQDGPRTTIEAVNAEGEPVTLTLNPRGVIVREEAR